MTASTDSKLYQSGSISKDVLEKLEQYIKDIKYGSVTLIIQDGHIIQIEKNEKLRFK